MKKKTKKPKKPLIRFEVSGNCQFEFSCAYVEAGSADEAKRKITHDIERAVEAEAGMTSGFEVDNLEAEAEMERKCAICGTEENDLSSEDQAITNGLPCLELSDNEAIGAPHIDGKIACPKCMDPKAKSKKAQRFRRHYMKIFRNYPNGRK